MAQLRIIISILIFTLSMALGLTAQAQTVVERQVIVTPVPAPKETVQIPTGYANCFTVDAGWVGNTWVPRHQVCQYEKAKEGVAWVQGYWFCNAYTNGDCTDWKWKPGRWVSTLEVY
jgi:hypothetical protein